MEAASERAVSIPQITYDHIDDTEEKKDVTFFQDGKRGSVEGNVMTALCSEHADVLTAVVSTCYVPDWSSTNITACFPSGSTVSLPVQHVKSLSPVSSSADLILHFINRHFIVNLTPQNAMFFGECAFFYTCQGHLASELVSCRGHSVPVTKQMTIVGKPALVCFP